MKKKKTFQLNGGRDDEVDPEEMLNGWFRMYDVNNDKKICKKELETIINNFGDGEKGTKEEIRKATKKILDTFDKDGDGKLNFEEFHTLMKDYAYDSE